jgi:pyruvate formate lyase activating enzyme
VISGGEPTLWPELEGFLGEVRALGYQTKLDTNGTRPNVLRRLLEQSLLDYVAMDLKDVPERYEQWLCTTTVAHAVRESIRLLQASSIAHEFRTTLEATRHDVETLAVLRQLITNAPWYLQSQTPTKRAGNTPFTSNELQHLVSRVEALAQGPVHLRRTGTG